MELGILKQLANLKNSKWEIHHNLYIFEVKKKNWFDTQFSFVLIIYKILNCVYIFSQSMI